MQLLHNTIEPSRRSFLRGDLRGQRAPIRPPWSLKEIEFVNACSRSHACIDACPEKIVVRGDGGFPRLDFRLGECTFCGKCADACTSGAYTATDQNPWSLRAAIGDACIARKRVVCRSCGEHCDAEAIRFEPQIGGCAIPVIDYASCNGCGACVAVCPTLAVSMQNAETFA